MCAVCFSSVQAIPVALIGMRAGLVAYRQRVPKHVAVPDDPRDLGQAGELGQLGELEVVQR